MCVSRVPFLKRGYRQNSLNQIPEGFGCFVDYNHVLVLFFFYALGSDQVLHVSAAWDGMEFLNMKAQHDELRAWARLRRNNFLLHSALAPRCLFRHGLPQHTDDF